MTFGIVLAVIWAIGVVFSAWPIPAEYGSIPTYGLRRRFLFTAMLLCLVWPLMSMLGIISAIRAEVADK